MNMLRFLRAVTLVAAVAMPLIANAESPAIRVADGKPWNATAPDGHKMTLTFFPDGKAKMKVGMMSRSLAWQPTADGLCLIGTPRGDRCMRLEATADGFIGFDDDAPTLTLSR